MFVDMRYSVPEILYPVQDTIHKNGIEIQEECPGGVEGREECKIAW